MELLDQNMLLLLAVAGSQADHERYKAYDRQIAEENLARLSSDVRHEAELYVAQGQLIAAVKIIREHLSLGLNEAKMVVDLMKVSRP